MSTLFAKLKGVDRETNHLVYGYCREAHRLFVDDSPYFSVQPLVVQTVMAHFWIPHRWEEQFVDTFLKRCVIDGALVKRDCAEGDANRAEQITVFVDTVMRAGHICRFKFKVNRIGEREEDFFDLAIGIINNDKVLDVSQRQELIDGFYVSDGFGFIASKALWSTNPTSQYGKICEDGDIVEMIVDLKKHTLRYEINGKDYGVMHKDIIPCNYRAAVYLYGAGTAVELL